MQRLKIIIKNRIDPTTSIIINVITGRISDANIVLERNCSEIKKKEERTD